MSFNNKLGEGKCMIHENYEWCNYWWDESDNTNKQRILLIGDSITWQYREYVKSMIGNIYCVDVLATSKSLDNPALICEVDHILDYDFTYRLVHFNNGLHGWHLSEIEYKLHLEKTLKYIMEKYKVPMIIAMSTPVTMEGDVYTFDDKLNSKIIQRNIAAEGIAEQYGLDVNDLYTLMVNKAEYREADGYHYNDTGKKAQAELVVKCIQSKLER